MDTQNKNRPNNLVIILFGLIILVVVFYFIIVMFFPEVLSFLNTGSSQTVSPNN
ncbi:hypothetical protein [Chryseobacterium sp.]|uniref:hypothetical protein n=1 Tax=Chryseobacterium sp. TaxID=1871047 RepID=UPI00388D49FB